MTFAKLGSRTKHTQFGAMISRDYNMIVSSAPISEHSAADASRLKLLYPPHGVTAQKQFQEAGCAIDAAQTTFKEQSINLSNSCLLSFYQSLESAAKAAQTWENGVECRPERNTSAKRRLTDYVQDYAVFSFLINDAIEYYDLGSIVISGFYD